MLSLDVQVSWRTPGVYVPQLGDEVVYLQVGHRKFLSHNNNKLQGPWDSIVSTLVSASNTLFCLSVCPSVCLSVSLSLCLSVCLYKPLLTKRFELQVCV